ncbi:group III truncated hemoglobin [Elstera cyanobacteriorum]|uniref:group III truncated hemoglobin n=1 Tax=Elstera cyanobacteriorum TaxID=2022747 RepID=UPI002354D350|nr:group III truncated hemoglobin [Elstera cyanobacteriorum]MCK6441719.1 group III truncated hemoglobin [Elstera cyanobacteriorum]
MRASQITETSIEAMVYGFYDKVRADAELGPVFNRALNGKWEQHLPKMVAFWSGVLLGTGAYLGNPMGAHRALPPFPEALFDRWLSLFADQLSETFDLAPSAVIMEKAQRMARAFRLGLYYDPAKALAARSTVS